MLRYLGVDAGGTSTRAAVVSADGTCSGIGHAGSGNPVSSGIDHAAAQVMLAARRAIRAAGCPPAQIHSAVAAMAGGRVVSDPDWLTEAAAAEGLPFRFRMESDLHATFASGTARDEGYAVVSGTGALAVRVCDGEIDLVSDGIGWLFGDCGSGFWIGQQVAREALAGLDRRGAPTVLSTALLEFLGLDTAEHGVLEGRPRAVQEIIDVLYSWRPVELGRLAPLAFAAAGDAVAEDIIARGADALATTLRAVRTPEIPGPVVFGGSVLTKQPRMVALVQERSEPFDEVLFTHDGLVGAASLALKRSGISVDEQVYQRLDATVAQQRARAEDRTANAAPPEP